MIYHLVEHDHQPRMRPIAEGIDVSAACIEIHDQPSLWNQFEMRTKSYNTPHRAIDDIWVRYNAWSKYNPKKPKAFHAEHDSVWYPAYEKLPALRPLIFGLMNVVAGERLGGVLITRVPPGHSIAPHKDLGWHAGYYRKFAVQLMGGPQQGFHFEGETLRANAGDVYEFDNSFDHWVSNDSPDPRMTMIVCIRTSGG